MRNLLLLLIALAVLGTGCASVGRKIDPTAASQLKNGQSMADVRGLIGAPDQVTRDGNGNETWMYLYSRASVKGATFIPVVGAFAGGMNTQNQSVVVIFANGTVSHVQSSFGGMDVNQGANSGSRVKLDETEQGKRPK